MAFQISSGALPPGAKLSCGTCGGGGGRSRRGLRGLGADLPSAPSGSSKKKAAAVGVLAILGIGAYLFWSRRAAAAPAYDTDGQPAVIPEYGAYSYTIGSNPADVGGLTAIAKREIGSEDLALWIYDLNRGIIGANINLIRSGDVIQIPTAESVRAAPALALSDFRRRYQALQAVFCRECTAASVGRCGRGTKNCGSKREGILAVGPDVSDPTVVPHVIVADHPERPPPPPGTSATGRSVAASSSFTYANKAF
mgnify:CR=1 FL=1